MDKSTKIILAAWILLAYGLIVSTFPKGSSPLEALLLVILALVTGLMITLLVI